MIELLVFEIFILTGINNLADIPANLVRKEGAKTDQSRRQIPF